MRHALIGLLLLGATVVTTPAQAAVNVSIGINVPTYPTLVRIPSYPVYYAPSMHANYFFYDGLYWVFSNGNWYSSHWYNGPWYMVDPFDVPVYVLRVPVRYYTARPTYFSGWANDAPPRWGEYWGTDWVSRRAGWDRWNRASAPAAAPLPSYQRAYSGNRYPTVTQQAAIQTKSYSYQPRDAVAKARFQEQRAMARNAKAEVKEVRKEAKEVRKEAKAVQKVEKRQAKQEKQAQHHDNGKGKAKGKDKDHDRG